MAEICQLADEVNGNVSGFGNILGSLVAPNDSFINGVELANLTDNQAGCRQGAALALKHITDGSGNIGKIQRHIV